jgi:hypothetical protein
VTVEVERAEHPESRIGREDAIRAEDHGDAGIDVGAAVPCQRVVQPERSAEAGVLDRAPARDRKVKGYVITATVEDRKLVRVDRDRVGEGAGRAEAQRARPRAIRGAGPGETDRGSRGPERAEVGDDQPGRRFERRAARKVAARPERDPAAGDRESARAVDRVVEDRPADALPADGKRRAGIDRDIRGRQVVGAELEPVELKRAAADDDVAVDRRQARARGRPRERQRPGASLGERPAAGDQAGVGGRRVVVAGAQARAARRDVAGAGE